MSYKISFRDKTSTTITTEDGDKLKALLLQKNRPDNIEINGELYRSSEVLSVKQAISTEDNVIADIFDTAKQIEAKDRCRGQHSIQLEINNIAKSYGEDWPKLIRNKKWREETRQRLLAKSDYWCDHKTGACACESDFISAKKRHWIGEIV